MKTWTGRHAQPALRHAAQGYVARGWDVVPGTYLVPPGSRARGGRRSVPGGCSCRRSDCSAPGAHPVDPDWRDQASTRPAAVDWWWASRPHAILLPVGGNFEVLDVPAHVGPPVLRMMREDGVPVGPVARTPQGRWQFLVAPGGNPDPDPAVTPDIRHLGAGSFLVAPPTRIGSTGAVRWIWPPAERNRCLVGARVVTRAIESACAALPSTAPGLVGAVRSGPRYLLGLASGR